MITDYISSLKYQIILSLGIVLGIGAYYNKYSESIDSTVCNTACVEVFGKYYDYADYGHSIVFDNVNYSKPKNNDLWYRTFNYNYYFKIVDSCQVFVIDINNLTNIKKHTCKNNYEYKTK